VNWSILNGARSLRRERLRVEPSRVICRTCLTVRALAIFHNNLRGFTGRRLKVRRCKRPGSIGKLNRKFMELISHLFSLGTKLDQHHFPLPFHPGFDGFEATSHFDT
jgi:hypothetical protein